MPKILTIAYREFTYNLRRPAFLFAVFGTPAILAVALIISFAFAGADATLAEYGTIGYVDNSEAQVLARDIVPEDYDGLFVRYDSTDAAEADARAGTLAAYLELPVDYLSSGRATLYTTAPASEDVTDAIDELLRANLTAEIENVAAVELLARGADLDVTVQDTNRRFDENGAFFVTMMPIIFGFLLILSSITTSTFLMNGLVEEKTNRIMEVLITSVRPMELLVGKLLGMGLLGLMQVLLFLGVGLIGVAAAQQIDAISGLTIPVDMAVLAIVYYLLSYFLLAAIGIAIGAIVGSEQESRQLSAIIVLPTMLPYMLLISFMLDPNGSLPTALSLIPFTAPMAVLMRSGLTAVPFWQIALSIAGLVLMNLLVLWVAARLFRWGVLSTNKMPGPGRLFQILRGRGPEIATPQPRQVEGA